VTPDVVLTLPPDARRDPGNPAVDLSAIRRSEAIINLLAARRLLRPRAIHDPAIVLLSVLAADVDSPDSGVPAALARSAAVRAAAAVAVAGAAMVGAAAGPADARPGSASAWVHVAAVAATVATVAGAAGSTGFALAGVLARLGRLPASVRREPAGWGYRPPITGRPMPPRTRRPRRPR
jgi:hypothetical protein